MKKSKTNLNECVFCEIVKRKEKSTIIYEDKDILSFMDKAPFNSGHVLVIPKKHYKYIFDMNEKETGILFRAVNRISKAVFNAIKADGLNIGQSNGEAASQQIFHVHVHIIPRFIGDSKNNMFPERKNITIRKLYETSKIIKKEL
jgi:histidine triad (HIT) family protein